MERGHGGWKAEGGKEEKSLARFARGAENAEISEKKEGGRE